MTGLGLSLLLPCAASCSKLDAGELDAPSTWKPTTFRRGVGLLPMLLRCRLFRSMAKSMKIDRLKLQLAPICLEPPWRLVRRAQ